MRNREAAEEGVETSEQLSPVVFEGGYQIPGDLYDKLFDYQKTGFPPLPQISNSWLSHAMHMAC